MTESEAIEMLRAYRKCQMLQVKGIYEDCNVDLCENCDLCYAQGNAGEHIKSIEMAIQALEESQARDKKVWHPFYEIPDTEDCYIVAWLPQGEQSGADSPHYYAIWSYEDGDWQIYVPNDFADKEIVLLAWTELPEPYHKECEENKVIDTDKIVERLENASYKHFGNDGMGGEFVVNLDDAIEIIRDGGK